MGKDKLDTDPSEQNVSSEEGKNVEASTIPLTAEEKELEKEIEEAANKLLEEDSEDDSTESEEELDSKEDTKDEDNVKLDTLNKLTGRDFKSVEDFEKHYKHLSSFVGSNPEEIKKKAEDYDKMMKKAEETKEKKTKKTDDLSNDVKERIDSQQTELQSIKNQLTKAEFLKKHPEAESVYEEYVLPLSERTNKNPMEVYPGSGLESLLKSKKELEEVKSKTKDAGVQSKSRLAPAQKQKIVDLVRQLKQAQKGGSVRNLDEIKQQLVEAQLGITS